jgi:hypothetical protein
MYKLQLRWLSSLVLAAAFVLCTFASTAADDQTLTKDQMKHFLLTAKVINSHESNKGVTNTVRLTLSDGTITHDASFQPINVHGGFKQFNDGSSEAVFVDSYKYNIAAYRLAEMIGFDDMMPVYVERMWKGNSGSLSWWLPVKMDDADRMKRKIQPPDQEAWNLQMYKIRVFDELVSDADANLTNVLIGDDWKLWRVDFTRAFRLSTNLRDTKDLVRCDRHLFEKIKALNGDEFAEKTKDCLTKPEIKGVMARRDKIVAQFQQMIAAQGESAILY